MWPEKRIKKSLHTLKIPGKFEDECQMMKKKNYLQIGFTYLLEGRKTYKNILSPRVLSMVAVLCLTDEDLKSGEQKNPNKSLTENLKAREQKNQNQNKKSKSRPKI